MIHEISLLLGYPIVYLIISWIITYYIIGKFCCSDTNGHDCEPSSRVCFGLFGCFVGIIIGIYFGVCAIIASNG